jgi:hypothetical protein
MLLRRLGPSRDSRHDGTHRPQRRRAWSFGLGAARGGASVAANVCVYCPENPDDEGPSGTTWMMRSCSSLAAWP